MYVLTQRRVHTEKSCCRRTYTVSLALRKKIKNLNLLSAYLYDWQTYDNLKIYTPYFRSDYLWGIRRGGEGCLFLIICHILWYLLFYNRKNTSFLKNKNEVTSTFSHGTSKGLNIYGKKE